MLLCGTWSVQLTPCFYTAELAYIGYNINYVTSTFMFLLYRSLTLSLSNVASRTCCYESYEKETLSALPW